MYYLTESPYARNATKKFTRKGVNNMADVKWIKISTKMFENRKIKQIRKLPDGDSIIAIWVQILCLAGIVNDNGMVYFTKDIPYTEEMLATEFDRPINLIRFALTTFENFKMVEIVDDILLVSNWEKYQSVDGLEKIREQNKIRQQRFRDKQKMLPEINVTHNGEITQSNGTDKDIDIEKELDIDIDKDICTESEVSVPEKMQAEKIFISLPLNDKTEHEVKESEVDAWKELYPAVNIEQQLRNMKGWLNANPAKRKTKKGINRFINSWLSREQDKGGSKNSGLYDKTSNRTKGKSEVYDYDKFFD